MIQNLSQRSREDIEIFLIRRSYVSRLRILDAISRRRSTYRVDVQSKLFETFRRQCLRNKVNPFHVISVAFDQKQLGDFAPGPGQLYDRDLEPQYRETSEAWRTYLAAALVHRWRADRFTLDCLSESLGCGTEEATRQIGGGHAVGAVFNWAAHYTAGLQPPYGLRDLSIQEYCMSPAAYAKAAAAAGLQLPTGLVKYGQIVKEIGDDQSR